MLCCRCQRWFVYASTQSAAYETLCLSTNTVSSQPNASTPAQYPVPSCSHTRSPRPIHIPTGLDLSFLTTFAGPTGASSARIAAKAHDNGPQLDDEILADADVAAAIASHGTVMREYDINNEDRSLLARVAGAIAEKHGDTGFKGKVQLNLRGSGGQSFGVFLTTGLEVRRPGIVVVLLWSHQLLCCSGCILVVTSVLLPVCISVSLGPTGCPCVDHYASITHSYKSKLIQTNTLPGLHPIPSPPRCGWWARPMITSARAWRAARSPSCHHQTAHSRQSRPPLPATPACTAPLAGGCSSTDAQVRALAGRCPSVLGWQGCAIRCKVSGFSVLTDLSVVQSLC